MIRELSRQEIRDITSKFSESVPEEFFKPKYKMDLVCGLELDPHLPGIYLMNETFGRSSLNALFSDRAVDGTLKPSYLPTYPCRESVLSLDHITSSKKSPLISIIANFEPPGLGFDCVWMNEAFYAPIEKAIFYVRKPFSEEVKRILLSDNDWLLNPHEIIEVHSREFYGMLHMQARF